MRPRRLLPALAAALLVALPSAGCGTKKLSTDKVEVEIEKGLKTQQSFKTVDVKCPREVEIKAMSSFDCPVTADKVKATVKVTQEDDQGNIRWQVKQPRARR
ncbi:MAG: DUF4333 domain-containing protein [Actinomycetota bacterium]|nr:DUF4333 domain-containing protein [Actinomycetota bacterium]